MAKAAVLTGVGSPLEIRDDVEVEDPHAGEVRVRIGASGVCHSDLSVSERDASRCPPADRARPRGRRASSRRSARA